MKLASDAETFQAKMRQVVDDLLAILDGLDGDPDLEPTLAIWSMYRESDADECEMPQDDEASLGWTGRTNQIRLCGGNDRELDTADDEPSLGSLQRDDQSRWGEGDRRDLEEQCEDEGA